MFTFKKKALCAWLAGCSLLALGAEVPKTSDAQDISALDANFVLRTLGKEKLEFYNPLKSKDFEITGLELERSPGEYYRLPRQWELFKEVPSGVKHLSQHTAGGTIRFTTNARRIGLRVKMRAGSDMNHMPRTGSCGFDFYRSIGDELPRYQYNVPMSPAHARGALRETVVFRGSADTKGKFVTWTVYLPLYGGVEFMEIGVNPGATFRANPPWRVKDPIVFYGSSITQGACASRPGNAYTTLLCRALNAPQINLGFSGNAKGEDCMAKLIAGKKMSALVYDYDYNSPSEKHLDQTHERFFKIIRRQQPNLPILILSRVTNYTNGRTAIVRRTWENAVKAGDRKVWFMEGAKLFDDAARDTSTVDWCHPNDLGFYQMYLKILPVLKDMLQLEK